MIKYLAHDRVNDVALIKSAASGLYVRYGLEVIPVRDMDEALKYFADCQRHSMEAEGHFYEKT